MKLKILCVDCLKGALNSSGVNYISFFDAQSFVDYDAVVIDPGKIPYKWLINGGVSVEMSQNGSYWAHSSRDFSFGRELMKVMARRAKEIMLLLEKKGGIVICMLRTRNKSLNYLFQTDRGSYTDVIHMYSWLPVKDFSYRNQTRDLFPEKKKNMLKIYRFEAADFNPESRNARDVGEIDKKHTFAQYFGALKDVISPEVVMNDAGLLRIITPIAKNKVDEVIAFEIQWDRGKFIFLPPFKPEDEKKVAGVLIDCVRKSLNWSIPLTKPEWLGKYELPGEKGLQKQLKDVERKLKIVDDNKKDIQVEINEIEMLKSLLYESGKYGLEPAVRKAFRILGFHVLEPEKYQEDYDLFAKEAGFLVIGEIEGTEKQVDVQKYRQLLDYVTDATLKGKKCKGILIGNGYKNMEPSQRTEQFTEYAIRGCESQKYCRIATTELYKAVKTILANPNNEGIKRTIKEKILSCESEFKLSSLQLPVNDKK